MRLLLDTHTFLWFVRGSSQLSQEARRLIEDSANDKLVSVVSAWETAIKASTGKMQLAQPAGELYRDQIAANRFTLLPIALGHLAPLETLPYHHKDPFDRLLIAQALAEGVPLVSTDAAFDAYAGVTRLW